MTHDPTSASPDPAPGVRAGVRLAYRLDGLPVETRVTDALAPAAAALFPDARAPAGDGPVELEVAGSGGEGFRVNARGRETRHPDAAGALAAFELALAETLVRRAAAIPLHAAGALLPGGAVALVGAGGRGKSTLAAALARLGRPVYGDDVLLLDGAAGRVRAFRRLLKLLPPAPTLLGLERPRGPVAELWGDSALYHPEELGSSWAEPAPLRAVLFLERDAAARGVELAPVGAPEAVRRLLSQLQLVERAGPAEFEAVAAAVDGAEAATLRYASAVDAARAVGRRWG